MAHGKPHTNAHIPSSGAPDGRFAVYFILMCKKVTKGSNLSGSLRPFVTDVINLVVLIARFVLRTLA